MKYYKEDVFRSDSNLLSLHTYKDSEILCEHGRQHGVLYTKFFNYKNHQISTSSNSSGNGGNQLPCIFRFRVCI